MKNFRFVFASALLVCLWSISAFGQVVNVTAGSIRGGPTLPSTCTPASQARRADVFIQSGVGPFYCSATNTWSAMGGGGGGGGVADPGANGVMVRTALNTTTARTLTGTTNRITITNGSGVSGAPTFDIGTDVVTLTGSQTLTNKTLTAPVIATISNTGTLTLPTSTDTLVGRATTDILTNKTLTAPTINAGALSGTFTGTPTFGAITVSSCTGCGGGSPGGSSGDYQINAGGGSLGAGVIAQSAGRLTATPSAASSGAVPYLRFITPADTALTTTANAPGIVFGGDASSATVSRQHATGTVAEQSEYVFIAPTYTAVAASACTICSTVTIDAAPVAGTNWTNTAAYALRVKAGVARFDGGIASPGSGSNTERFGTGANPNTATNSLVIGNSATISAGLGSTIVIGYNASSQSSNQVVIGTSATNNAAVGAGVVIGSGAATNGANNVVIGPGSPAIGASATESVGVGSAIVVSSSSVVAIGSGAGTQSGDTTASASVVLGRGALLPTGGANTFLVGSSSYPTNNWYGGKGVTNGTPTAYTINGTGGSGSNIAGADLQVAGGKGTGTGAGGKVNIQVAPAGSSGSSLNSLSTVGQFDDSTTAGATRFLLWDITAAALKRVEIGAADSCGTGYKCLRVAN